MQTRSMTTTEVNLVALRVVLHVYELALLQELRVENVRLRALLQGIGRVEE